MNTKNLNKMVLILLIVIAPFSINSITYLIGQDFIVYLNIGQGNATLICTQYRQCGLVDTGKQENIIENIKKYTNKSLDFLILTHPDIDHTKEAINIINSIGVSKIFLGFSNKSQELKNKIANLAIPLYELREDNDFSFGNFYFDILWPSRLIPLNWLESNDTSTSILISHHNHTFFIAGDLGSRLEEKIIQDNNIKDISIDLISHHGSKNSSSVTFLAQLRAKLSIISTGKNNYGHPSKEVIGNLENLNLKYFRTDISGNIKIDIFEDRLEVNLQKSKNSYIILN